MNLVIDIGNTRTKLAWFSNNRIVEQTSFLTETINIRQIIKDNTKHDIILSSVNKNIDASIKDVPILKFTKSTTLPITNQYKSDTIGVDRLAAAVGAYSLFPNTDCLIIDLGSAITIDFLNSKSEYKGGNISPGMLFRFKSLNNFTSNLPLVDQIGEINLISQNSTEAIRSGVVNGILFELGMYIDIYKKQYPKLHVILTGGDSIFFANQLKNRIFANNIKPFEIGQFIKLDTELVLKGLNTILKGNVSKI